MANLQLIGAVGVRVRPDTDGFRNQTKREVMAQLSDLEGKDTFGARVKPLVDVDPADVRKAMDRAFKSLVTHEISQKVRVNPLVDKHAWDNAIRKATLDAVPKHTPIRIAADTASAQKELGDLASEMDQLDVQLKRIPGSLEELDKEYASRMSKIQENIDKATDAQNGFETELGQVNDRLLAQRELVKSLTKVEEDNRVEIAMATAEREKAAKQIEALTQAWKDAAGNPEEKARIQAEKKALQDRRRELAERIKSLREDLKINQQMLKPEAQRLALLEKQSGALKSQVTEQKRIRRAANEAAADALKRLEDEKGRLDLFRKEGIEQKKLIDAEIARIKAEQAAREKANASLRADLMANGLNVQRFMRSMALAGAQTGDTFRAMRRHLGKLIEAGLIQKSQAQQALADMKELQKRSQEHGKQRVDMLMAEAGVRQRLRIQDEEWEPKFVTNFDKQLREVNRFAEQAERALNRGKLTIAVNPEVNVARAALAGRHLDEMSRPRDVELRPKVTGSVMQFGDLGDEQRISFPVDLRLGDTKRFTTDVTRALSGINIAQKMGEETRRAMREFDDLAIGAGKTAVKITAVSASLSTAVGWIARMGSDLGQLSGLALGATAMLSGLGMSVYATKVGFEGFNAAVNGDKDALKKLSPVAREAAREVGRLNTAVRRSAKINLWRGIEDSLRDMARAVRGPLVQGMNGAALATGAAWAGIFRSFEKFAESGRMEAALDRIGLGMMNASKATEPLFDGLLRITDVGARYMPRMGVWATENAIGFEKWARAADEAGDMDRWMERAIDHSQSLFGATASATRVIGNLGSVAAAAGIGGIAALATSLRKLDDYTNSGFFRTNMENIFAGSVDAWRSMVDGFGDITTALLNQSPVIESIMRRVGRSVENVFSAVAGALDNPSLTGGFLELFADLEVASRGLAPIFDKLATGAGEFAAMAGEMVKGAVQIADAFVTVLWNSENLSASLERAIPWFTGLTAAMVEMTHAPITMLMNGVAGLVNGFMAMPEPLQLAALAMAATALGAGKIAKAQMALKGLTHSFRASTGEIGGWRKTWATAMATTSQAGRAFLENSKMISGQDRAIARTAFAVRDLGEMARRALPNLSGLGEGARRVGDGMADGVRRGLSAVAAVPRNLGQRLLERAFPLSGSQQYGQNFGRQMLNGVESGLNRQLTNGTTGLFSRMFPMSQTFMEGQALGKTWAQGVATSVAASSGPIASAVNRVVGVMREAGQAIRQGLARDFSDPVGNSQNFVFRKFGSELAEVRRQSQLTGGTLQNLQAVGARVAGALQGARGAASGLASAFQAVRTSSVVTGLGQVASAARTAAGAIGATAGTGLRIAASGLSAALGGPWGIALSAATVALTTFALKAADTRAKVDEIRSTFDEFGTSTADTSKVLAESLNTAKASFLDFDLRRIIGDGPKDVGSALKELGLTSSETADMLLNDRKAYDELAQAMVDLGKGYAPSEEALTKLSHLTGISTDRLREMAPFLADAGDAMQDVAGNADAAGAAFDKLNGKVTPVSAASQDLAAAFATMGDEAANAEDRVSALNDVLDRMNNKDTTAEDMFAGMHESARNAAETIANLHTNVQDLDSVIDNSTGSFKRTTDAGNDLWNELERVSDASKAAALESDDMLGTLVAGKAAFLESAESAGITGQALEDLGAAYDFVAGGTPDKIVKTFELKGGESVTEAEQTMKRIADEWDAESFEAWLQLDSTQAKIEGKSAQEIARMFADDTYLAELDATAEGAEAAITAVESRGMEWELSDYEAWLDANPEMAKLAVLDAKSVAEAYAKSKYRARLEADGDMALEMIETLKGRGDEFNESRFEAWLGLNEKEFSDKGLTVDQILDRWDSEPHEVRVGLDDSQLRAKMGEIDSQLLAFDQPYEATITGDSTNFDAVIQRASQLGAEISEPDRFKAWIGANSEEFDAKKLTIDEILQLWKSEPNEIKISANGEDVDLKIENLDQRLKALTGNPHQIRLQAEDWSAKGLEVAKGSIRDNWELYQPKAKLESENMAGGGLNAALGMVSTGWVAQLFSSILGADDNSAAGIGAAQGSVDSSWTGTPFDALLGATDMSAPAVFQAAMSLGASWAGREFAALLTATNMVPAYIGAAFAVASSWAGQRFAALLEATNNAGAGVGAALGVAATFAGRVFAAILDGNPAPFQGRLGGAVAAGVGFAARTFRAAFDGNPAQFQSRLAGAIAQGVSFAARTFRAAFDGNPGPFQAQHGAVVSMGAGFAARTFSAAFDATTGGVSAALSVALSIGASWAARRFSAIFDAITPNADGNLWAGGSVQAFAGGGFSNHSIAKVLASRSPSQRESHLAQIAAAKTPFRIWAEPETGGEAYIPLASAKRARSTRIWEETGNRLGVQWEAYADGGTRGGHSSKSATGRGGSGRNVVVNVTTHYPVAEAASITTNRALQLAANLI